MSRPRKRLSSAVGVVFSLLLLALMGAAYPASAEESVIPIPAPDPTAADIDFTVQPPESAPLGLDGGIDSSGQDCDSLKEKFKNSEETFICVKQIGEKDSAKLSANQLSAGAIPWCATSADGAFNRFELCLKGAVAVELWSDNVKKGIAIFAVTQEIVLHPDTKAFTEDTTVVPSRIDPALRYVSLDWANYCEAECWQSSDGPWDTSKIFYPNGDSAQFQIRRAWTGSGQERMNLAWSVIVRSPEADNPAQVDWGGADVEVRCDDEVGSNAGCVFPRYTPTFTINRSKYPAPAYMIALAQHGLPDHFGLEGKGKKLERDSAKATTNRRIICDSTFKADPATPNPQCDEYAFAATKQSGAQVGVTSGSQCAQEAAYTQGGQWYMKVISLSGNERCIRASMPGDQNEGVGGDLGRFVMAQRVVDGEGYWVDSING